MAGYLFWLFIFKICSRCSLHCKPGLGLLRPEGIEEAMEVKLFVGKGWRKKAFRTQWSLWAHPKESDTFLWLQDGGQFQHSGGLWHGPGLSMVQSDERCGHVKPSMNADTVIETFAETSNWSFETTSYAILCQGPHAQKLDSLWRSWVARTISGTSRCCMDTRKA